MRVLARFAVAALVMLAAFVFAEPALATTFCVPDTSIAACPVGAFTPLGSDAGARLQSAMGGDASDGTPDTVYVGPGTYADSLGDSFQVHGSDDLTVIGAGREQTILTSIATTNSYVLDLISGNSRHVTMKKLAIVVPESFPNGPGYGSGLQSRGDDFESVDMVNENAPLSPSESGSSGFANVTNGGKLTDVRIFGRNGARFSTAVGSLSCGSGQVLVADSRISGAVRAIDTDCPEIPFTVSRSVLSGNDWAFSVSQGADLTATNVLIESGDYVPIDVYNSTGDGTTTVNLDHLTLVATGDPALPAIRGGVSNSSGAVDSVQINLTNSIVAGFDNSYELTAPIDPAKGEASLNVDHSNLTSSGTTVGDTNFLPTSTISEPPGFTGLTDFHLKPGSPAIDSGDPDTSLPAVDLDGNSRPVDGNCDDIPVRDMGAYEFMPPPTLCVTPSCEIDPAFCPQVPDKTAPRLGKVKFKYRFRKGGKLSFRLSEKASVIAVFRPTPKARGKKRKVVRISRQARSGVNRFKLGKKALKPGRYKLTVRATDPAGNKSRVVTRKIRIKPSKRPK